VNSQNEKGITTHFYGKHVYGIPNLDLGISATVALHKNSIVINDTQIIPLERFEYAQAKEAKHIVLNEKQKSIIGRAIGGGILLGPIGAIVGGMTGIGSTVEEKEVTQSYIQISYTNLDGDIVDALFLTTFGIKLNEGIAEKFNVNTGRILPQLPKTYEI
jgi:hypothetical protein